MGSVVMLSLHPSRAAGTTFACSSARFLGGSIVSLRRIPRWGEIGSWPQV